MLSGCSQNNRSMLSNYHRGESFYLQFGGLARNTGAKLKLCSYNSGEITCCTVNGVQSYTLDTGSEKEPDE